MKNNKIKKILGIASLFLFVLTVLFIVDKAYGLLQTKSSGDVKVNPAKWVIKLNGTDVSSGVINNFVINNITYEDNDNIKEGKIAPGRSGYFDIELDPTGTEVAIRYDIFVDLESTDYPENITFRTEDLSNGNAVLTATNTFSGVVSLDEITSGEKVTIRLYVDWTNDSNYDETDTTLGEVKNNKLEVPVTVTINQYQGEEITPME